MILYVIPTPENILERKHRVAGWRMVMLDRAASKRLQDMAKHLKDSGAARVLCSDLDEEAGRILGRELKLPVKAEFSLRRFNFGRHHAAPEDKANDILQELETKWEKNPAIPIRGGDSWMSFEKRFVKAIKNLLDQDGTSILATDVRMVGVIRDNFTRHSLVQNGNAPKRTSIYKVEK